MEQTKKAIRYIGILFILVSLVGCAGKGSIKRYEFPNGVRTLVAETEFSGVNIKGTTDKGASFETKSVMDNIAIPKLEFD